ncbi:MAG: CHASE2 domain-containing protein [Pseudomonadota bacterium]|nr:CHASE2 domain-containing protein [Pseudomonadota bacterium]
MVDKKRRISAFWKHCKDETQSWLRRLLRSPAPLAKLKNSNVQNLILTICLNAILHILRSPLPVWIPRFRHWNKKRQRFANNLYYGSIIQIVVFALTLFGFESIVNIQTSMLDSSMRFVANLPLYPDRHRNLLFIDVDEATFRNSVWGGGEPRQIPLNSINKLLDYIVEQQVRYVVVDFLIDGKTDADQENFKAHLEQILNNKKYSETHFIFARSSNVSLTQGLAQKLRSSVLDDIIARYPNRVHAAAPLFLKSRHDNVLRHWLLWDTVCESNLEGPPGSGHWVVLPSVQALIKAMEESGPTRLFPPLQLGSSHSGTELPCAVDGANTQAISQAIGSQIAEFEVGKWVQKSFGTCYEQGSFTSESCEEERPPTRKPIGSEKIKVDQNLGNRLLYTISDRNDTSSDKLTIPIPYFIRQSALDVLEGAPTFEFVNGGPPLVAFIGASYIDSRDIHNTPLGYMPGTLVLVNATDSMLQHGVMQPPGKIVKILTALLCLIAISYLFAILSNDLAVMGSMMLVMLALFPISLILLQSQGVHLDLAAPLVAVYLNRELERQKERLNRH